HGGRVRQRTNVLGSDPERREQVGKKPVDIIQNPLPAEADDDRREGPGHNEEHSIESGETTHLVEAERQQKAEQELSHYRSGSPPYRRGKCRPEFRVGDQPPKIVQPDDLMIGTKQVLVGQAVVDTGENRIDEKADDGEHARQDESDSDLVRTCEPLPEPLDRSSLRRRIWPSGLTRNRKAGHQRSNSTQAISNN